MSCYQEKEVKKKQVNFSEKIKQYFILMTIMMKMKYGIVKKWKQWEKNYKIEFRKKWYMT